MRTSLAIALITMTLVLIIEIWNNYYSYPVGEPSTHKIELQRVDGGKLFISGKVVKDSSQEYAFESAAILLLANTTPRAIEGLCPFYRQELTKYAESPGFILWTSRAEVVRCMPIS